MSVRLRAGMVALLIAGLSLGALLFPLPWLLAGLTVHQPLSPSDAVILVGGAFEERAPAAAMLYREGYAPLVILANDGVSGAWSPQFNRNLYQVEWAAEELVRLGVPRERMVKLPYYGSSTMFDALAAQRFLSRHGLKRIIVVTSDYHTRRTLWTFRRALKKLTGDITVFPAKSSATGSKTLAFEYCKLGYYLLRYGVLNILPELNEVALKKV